MTFGEFFAKATGHDPYPYQCRLAQGPSLPTLLKAPTGSGKTEAAVLGWLWRWKEHPQETVRRNTARRLVYCLPMRSLVEQTVGRIEGWVNNLQMERRVGIVALMGGEPPTQWYLYPEQPFIIVGTQDMLLSRALNRGYGVGPSMWPVEYGLLNNDCLWVLDEIQLMANGLPTSTQLAGLRHRLETFGPSHSMWMSATVQTDWLATVDHPAPSEREVLELGRDDMAHPILGKRHHARKMVSEANVNRGAGYARRLANLIVEKHVSGTLTLAIVNTVERAQQVYRELDDGRRVSLDAARVLVHSRFREEDRSSKNDAVSAGPEAATPGMVVVATQAVEAGMDISARTLITELAPWSSMVQRFGRCNRAGDDEPGAIFWVDTGERGADTAPYRPEEVAAAREQLKLLEGYSAGPADLTRLGAVLEEVEHRAVIRRRDVVGLFDTTPDLSGGYLDVSMYVRGDDERDVSVYWRDIPPEGPGGAAPRPRHSEIVKVPIGGRSGQPTGIRDYLADGEGRIAWGWDFLDDRWRRAQPREIHPGMTLMLDSQQGGYSPDIGWDASGKERMVPVPLPVGTSEVEDGQGSDPGSTALRKAVALSDHCRHVEDTVRAILGQLSAWGIEPAICEALAVAALYHDAGKAHPAFQRMMWGLPEGEALPANAAPLAKSVQNARNERRHFRHELGSALAILEHAPGLDETARDLAAYLAAAHHGKIRLGIRALPGPGRANPDSDRLLGYPVAAPETLPQVDLGAGLQLAETTLDLSIARIGMDRQERRSWLDRSTALLDQLGPFRLGVLETLIRAADMRASKLEQEDGE
ncbi:MAG: CRISPR-associated endonuclease Cas3'' [Chloroflexi bacterium]|nr:CRISPR-associated endonuclease Cas3'' [Chloroflexota bacterium]